MSTPEKSDVVILNSDDKTSCKIHLFGATLISWICEGDELIFVSSKVKFDNKSAIRGGVPIVFPNFGPWTQGPQHGFARISRWSLERGPEKDDCGNVVAAFTLEDSAETRAAWNNHRFKATLTVMLSNRSLNMTLEVINKGTETMSFTCLLHTYFRVPDVALATISNLKGISYIDKAKDGKTFTEERDLVQVTGFVDSIYPNTSNEHRVSGLTGGKTVSINKRNFPDTVVWNPGKEKGLQMADLGEDYIHMLCVEAGHVTNTVGLEASGTFTASQTLSVV